MCECCDHPLQHLIRGVLARYDAPIPRPTYQTTMQNLRDGLLNWEDEQ